MGTRKPRINMKDPSTDDDTFRVQQGSFAFAAREISLLIHQRINQLRKFIAGSCWSSERFENETFANVNWFLPIHKTSSLNQPSHSRQPLIDIMSASISLRVIRPVVDGLYCFIYFCRSALLPSAASIVNNLRQASTNVEILSVWIAQISVQEASC